jgi:hypothetical protein
MPYVTGHRYRIHWGAGLDFTQMRVEVSERWREGDDDIYFNTNFTDTREAINVTTQYGAGAQIGEGSLSSNYRGTFGAGDNRLANATHVREFEFAINGRDPSLNHLLLEGLRCISGECPLENVDTVPIEPNPRYWSNP